MPANTQTITSKIGIIYSDIPNNFNKAPFTDDLAKVVNENSVKQSIKNICKTILGERPYDNTIGQAADYSLFGLNNALTQTVITQALTDALKLEPRAKIANILVDAESSLNAVQISIYFTIINNPNLLSVQIVLDRVR